MQKRKKGLATLILGLLTALFLACVPPAFALPTADNLGVEDTNGYKGTTVLVPVNITKVQSGPVICILFDVAYDTSVINVGEVQNGDLTSYWDTPTMSNFAWGTRVSIVYDGQTAHAIQNGSTGSVVLLKFSVIGKPGRRCKMMLSNIQLADTAYQVGTTSAKNGTFSILTGGGGSSGTRAPPSVVVATPMPSPSLVPIVVAVLLLAVTYRVLRR